MKIFVNKKDQLIYEQHQIIESISSTNEQFDSLRQKLNLIKENILNEFNLFKKESIQIYNNSYQLISQSINESYQTSKEIINIIPPAISDRLQNEITKINTDYLSTKKAIIKSIYLIKTDILQQQDTIINEFEEKKENWNLSRFRLLIDRAKNQFLPIKPFDYSSIYKNFYEDQQKFNNCFRKTVSDISLIIPPDQFSQDALKDWWSKVEEFLKLHDNFIDNFSIQFQSQMNQNIEKNNEFISDIETELFELTKNMTNNEESRDAQFIIDELNNLCRTNEKVNLQFIEKIKNYFSYSQECLKKSFESIHVFYQEMIENHQNYIDKLNERETNETEEKIKTQNDKKSAIDKLESEINESIQKIEILVSEKEIDDETSHCKKLLSQIEQENRNYYEKMLSIYESQPLKVTQIFEESEKVVLNFLKLKKNMEVKSSTNIKKNFRGKNQSKQKDGRNKPTTSESFKIECGIEFESVEPLVVIPPFTDFFDLPPIQTKSDKSSSKSEKNEKGRRTSIGKKNSSKTTSKSGKNSSQIHLNHSSLSLIDFNETEISNFELNDVIPKIDDKIAIYISHPTADDFNEWFGQFKTVYMNFFYNIFESNLKKSKNEKNKEFLLNEFNESLRILHPRFSSIEVNFAEARKVKIESQKDQLDLYFRRISLQFNSLVSKFQTKFENNNKNITNEVEKLMYFSNDLKNQKNGRLLANQRENFRISDKNCQLKMADFFNGQEKSLTDFFSFFKTKNERFKNTCLNQKEGTYSDEEKKMALDYFENMDKQMNEIHNIFKNNLKINKTKLESLHKEIVKEFDNSYQFHSIDVKFIDENASIQTEFIHKFNSLKIQNLHQQQEIQKALDEIDLILNKSLENNAIENHSNEINLIFNCLEFLRLKLLNRSIFLCQLKSEIQNDTTVFQIDLNQDQEIKKVNLVNKSNTNFKNASSKSKISKTKSSSKSQNKKIEQENKNKKGEKKQVISFSSELEVLQKDFISRITKISGDYYNQFKTRKVEITRQNEIPQQQNDYLNKTNEFWSNLTNSKDSIMRNSILKFRYQVISAMNKAKEAEKLIFTIFFDFCSRKNEIEMNLVQIEIEKEINNLRKEKEKNRSLLNFKLTDENNISQLESLIETEQKRAQNERKIISKVKNQIFEIEKNCSKNFLNRLNYLTAVSLSFFDKFILIEDLVEGPAAENEQRKTLKALRKNKIRLMNLLNSNYKRPFPIRNWPESNQVSKILEQFNTSNKVENLSNDELKEDEINNKISEDLKNKRRKSKNEEAIRPDSTKQSGRKQKELKNKKVKGSDEDENLLKSFDTSIHRAVMIEKKRVLDKFVENLEIRAKKFNEFTSSLKNEEEIFENFWQKRISYIKPTNNSLPKLDSAQNI